MNETAWDIIKRGLITFGVRRLMEWAGGFLIMYGLTQDDVTIVVTAIVTSLLAIGWSYWAKVQDIKQTPPNDILSK